MLHSPSKLTVAHGSSPHHTIWVSESICSYTHHLPCPRSTSPDKRILAWHEVPRRRDELPTTAAGDSLFSCRIGTFHIKAAQQPHALPHRSPLAAHSSFISFGRQLMHQPLNGIQQFCCSPVTPFLSGTAAGNGGGHLSPPQMSRSTSPGLADLVTLSFQEKALQEVTNSPTTRS